MRASACARSLRPARAPVLARSFSQQKVSVTMPQPMTFAKLAAATSPTFDPVHAEEVRMGFSADRRLRRMLISSLVSWPRRRLVKRVGRSSSLRGSTTALPVGLPRWWLAAAGFFFKKLFFTSAFGAAFAFGAPFAFGAAFAFEAAFAFGAAFAAGFALGSAFAAG